MQGSCLCGQVTFDIQHVLTVVNCHCTQCRQMSGAAFSSYVVVRDDHFGLTTGKDKVATYDATERATKHFCTSCGSAIYNVNPELHPGLSFVYLGTLDDHEGLTPKANIHCSSKLPWVDTLSSLHNFDEEFRKG